MIPLCFFKAVLSKNMISEMKWLYSRSKEWLNNIQYSNGIMVWLFCYWFCIIKRVHVVSLSRWFSPWSCRFGPWQLGHRCLPIRKFRQPGDNEINTFWLLNVKKSPTTSAIIKNWTIQSSRNHERKQEMKLATNAVRIQWPSHLLWFLVENVTPR